MGKRLKRIFQKEIPAVLPSLAGKELHFILKNNVTIHGILSGIKGNQLEVKNRISGTHSIMLDSIEEIIMDFVAPY